MLSLSRRGFWDFPSPFILYLPPLIHSSLAHQLECLVVSEWPTENPHLQPVLKQAPVQDEELSVTESVNALRLELENR